MSSFLHNSKHYNSIRLGMKAHIRKNTIYKAPTAWPTPADDVLFAEIDEATAQIAYLTDISTSVAYKYGRLFQRVEEAREFVEYSGSVQFSTDAPISLYKAIQSALYQLDGDELGRPITAEEQAAIDFYKKWENTLGREILAHLPEYQAAQWAIE